MSKRLKSICATWHKLAFDPKDFRCARLARRTQRRSREKEDVRGSSSLLRPVATVLLRSPSKAQPAATAQRPQSGASAMSKISISHFQRSQPISPVGVADL